ncbi:MAG: phosphoadenosine phosphosulfate reductase family protein [Ruminococcus sp.]|nr:phosphoadenosine phosphosulfate reductase family protein [Ruminococcus sp.]
MDNNLNIPIRRCSCCIMPEVPNHIEFDSNGLCSSCREFKNINIETPSNIKNFDSKTPEEKKEIFLKKISKYKSKESKYDCLVAVSGGKDSIMTLYTAHKLGLNPLALFIDNGFALQDMYDNIKNATDILNIDCLMFRTNEMKRIFKYFIESTKPIYYCRVCHILLEVLIKDVCNQYGIKLILGGYTKGQSYLKQSELSWIFEKSDENTIEVLSKYPDCEYLIDIIKNPVAYSLKHYKGIVQVSPFKYLDYDEETIIDTIKKELKFKVPENSWPKNSTNCSFNYISQYLAMKQFGYSQHETEFSDLVRSGEMSRERAESLINTPITIKDFIQPLESLKLSLNNIEECAKNTYK